MQLLGKNNISAQTVIDVLKSENVVYSIRFVVLNQNDVQIGELSGVIEAEIENDSQRNIKKILKIKYILVEGDPEIVPFLTKIQPYVGININGTFIEWPQGVFLVSIPSRELNSTSVPIYSGNFFDYNEFRIWNTKPYASTTFKDLPTDIFVENIFKGIGITNYVLPSSVEVIPNIVVTSDTYYGEILRLVAQANGFYDIYTDGNGTLQYKTVPNYTTSFPEFEYHTDANSIIFTDASFSPRLDKLANRLKLTTSNNSLDQTIEAIVLAEPNHPFSVSNLGYYIDVDSINDPIATSFEQLQKRGKAELAHRLQLYQTIKFDSRAVPAHETYDIISFQYSNDVEFGEANKFLIQSTTFNLFTFTMSHQIARIVNGKISVGIEL